MVKRKDFQKTSAYIHEFLLKISEDNECAELRDALSLALLHMQKYYHLLQLRCQSLSSRNSSSLSNSSFRGLSPMTPFRDAPEKFMWQWINLDHPNMLSRSVFLPNGSINSNTIPLVHRFCRTGDFEKLDQLYNNNSNSLSEVDSLGRSPLTYAVHFGQNEVVRWLLDKKCSLSQCDYDGSTALHRACHDGNWSTCELLLKNGSPVDCQDNFGRAPVHWAVTTTTTKCLKLLIAYNCNVNIQDNEGVTPSMWACRLDNIDHFGIISAVKSQKIDEPDGIERDNIGRTWLHWSIRRSEPLECLKTLLTEETALLKDSNGKTVMLLSAELGALPACKIIVDIVGKQCVHDSDEKLRTPLHLAALGGHGEVVNWLIENGADIEKCDHSNATAWDYARNRQLHYCMLIIASHYRQKNRKIQSSNNSNRTQEVINPLPCPPSFDKTPPSTIRRIRRASLTDPNMMRDEYKSGPNNTISSEYNNGVMLNGENKDPTKNGTENHKLLDNMNVSDDEVLKKKQPVSHAQPNAPNLMETSFTNNNVLSRPETSRGQSGRKYTHGAGLSRTKPPNRLQKSFDDMPIDIMTIENVNASQDIQHSDYTNAVQAISSPTQDDNSDIKHPLPPPPSSDLKRRPIYPPQLLPIALSADATTGSKKKKKRRKHTALTTESAKALEVKIPQDPPRATAAPQNVLIIGANDEYNITNNTTPTKSTTLANHNSSNSYHMDMILPPRGFRAGISGNSSEEPSPRVNGELSSKSNLHLQHLAAFQDKSTLSSVGKLPSQIFSKALSSSDHQLSERTHDRHMMISSLENLDSTSNFNGHLPSAQGRYLSHKGTKYESAK